MLLALLVAYIGGTGGWEAGVLPAVVLAVLAVDLVGGVVTTTSAAAGRERHSRRFRLGFVACHVLHLVVVGVVFGTGWAWTVGNAAFLLAAAVTIEWAPPRTRRVVAVTAFASGVLVDLLWLPVPPVVAWVPGLLFLKLLVGFLGSMGTSAH
ncbi:hypothetical protein ACQP04_35290 [Pseudonocardia halophobica]|uniref:hypothetical protein n=1 Tax=Pseudonocardia halophobica TaxID=29401 RepID=UPI003D950494